MNSEFVYGIQPVLELIQSDKEVERIFVQKDADNPKITEILKEAAKLRIPVAKVPIWKINKITRKNHQGVVAYVSPITYASLDHIITQLFSEGKTPFILVLDRITDVRNFGGIARTAECAGVHAIVIPDKGSAQIGSDAIRTSAGALNHIPVCRVKNLTSTLTFLQNSGLETVACTEKASESIYQMDFSIPLAVIMGSEEDGINNELLAKTTHIAKIPMDGKVSSLNVSVATGIILFEANRQKMLG